MDKSEVNLRVAELIDLKSQFCYLRQDNNTGELYACDVYGDTPVQECVLFDPVNNPTQREPLMMELLKSGWTPHYEGYYQYYQWKHPRKHSIYSNYFGLTTCLAFIEMRESKKV